MSIILAVQNLRVMFGTRVILRDVNLTASTPGCTVLLGPSGTGKSTLLRVLAGFIQPSPTTQISGQIVYAGQSYPLTTLPAMVMQKAPLLMVSVLDNLVSELPQRSNLTRSEQVQKIKALLTYTGQIELLTKLSTPAIDLPLHQQRIVSILRKSISEPALLMIDEPTANLQPECAKVVDGVIQILAQKSAVLMISHHLAQTRQVAQKVVLLADGVVQESAATDDFFDRPESSSAKQFVRTGSCPELGLAISAEAAPEELPHPQGPLAASNVFYASGKRPYKSAYCGPRGFLWMLPGQLAGTPWPGILRDTSEDLQALKEVGITRLVSLTEVPFDALIATSYGISCSSYPIKDMEPPSMICARDICIELDRFLASGDAIAVHCKAGLGRTGTILAAYWIWQAKGSVSGEESIRHVRQLDAGLIQSTAQEDFLERFAKLMTDSGAKANTLE